MHRIIYCPTRVGSVIFALRISPRPQTTSLPKPRPLDYFLFGLSAPRFPRTDSPCFVLPTRPNHISCTRHTRLTVLVCAGTFRSVSTSSREHARSKTCSQRSIRFDETARETRRCAAHAVDPAGWGVLLLLTAARRRCIVRVFYTHEYAATGWNQSEYITRDYYTSYTECIEI